MQITSYSMSARQASAARAVIMPLMRMKAIGMNFTQMVEAEIPALQRHARTVTRDSDIADDIVQDTLVRALRFAHLFQGDNVRGWLHTILIN